MNSVKLLGHFAEVTAYTDGSIKVVDEEVWEAKGDYKKATFLASDSAWIEVRVRTDYFDWWYTNYVKGREVVMLDGKLCTEVSRGSGIVKNYIWIG